MLFICKEGGEQVNEIYTERRVSFNIQVECVSGGGGAGVIIWVIFRKWGILSKKGGGEI